MTILLQLFFSFGKIGLFALGGGNSLIKLIEEECVERQGWLTASDYAGLVGASFLFPGLTAVKVAGVIGLNVAGVLGLIVAVLGVIVPGLLLMALAYTFIQHNKDKALVAKLTNAAQYAGLALIAAALFSFTQTVMGKGAFLPPAAAILTLALFLAVSVGNFSPFLALVVFMVLFVVVA